MSQQVNTQLIMSKASAMVALEQLDDILTSTLRTDLRQPVAAVYQQVMAHEVVNVNVAGVLYNLVMQTVALMAEPPPPNSMDIGGIQVYFED